jgi:F0F1-type ATP synthase delta subunit
MSGVAGRYALALLRASRSSGALPAVRGDLKDFAAMLAEAPLAGVAANPFIPRTDKSAMMKEVRVGTGRQTRERQCTDSPWLAHRVQRFFKRVVG